MTNSGTRWGETDGHVRINKYFDGRTTIDEIRFRTDISLRDMRHVLQRFDSFVRLFFVIVHDPD